MIKSPSTRQREDKQRTSLRLVLFGIPAFVLSCVVLLQVWSSAVRDQPASRIVDSDSVSNGLEHQVVSVGDMQAANSEDTTSSGNGNSVKSIANATKKPLEFSKKFINALTENDALYPERFGRWASPCDPCQSNCLEETRAMRENHPPVHTWGDAALDDLVNDMVAALNKTTGITFDHHVSMVSCSYRTRTHFNPSGIWIHINGTKLSSLRQMADGYGRYKNVLKFITKVVEQGPPLPPMVFYVSVTDTPCNPHLPYLTFFLKRGMKQIVIPDDTFHGNTWEKSRETLLEASRQIPYESKKNDLFFRGSPTHGTRQNISQLLKACCPKFGNVTLAVMEKFKHLQVPLKEHALHKHLLAIRGRTASSRDKHLNLLNSTIVRAEEFEPWFQFYHVLWKPWVNYVPVTQDSLKCVVNMLQDKDNEAQLKTIAARGAEIGEFLTQEKVDEVLRKILLRYASMQQYIVDEDPILFLKRFNYFVKKRYKNAQVMPDDRAPVKFMFTKWISRRVKQMLSCRNNGTYIPNSTQKLAYNSPYKCWY